MIKTVDMDFTYMNTIQGSPRPPKDLLKQACANDGLTIESWEKIWIDQYRANHEKYGPFNDNSIGKIWGRGQQRPCIVVGSGPSLANNIKVLSECSPQFNVISCLHNFHYMVDNGVDVDYYVTLDAGPVTVEEISEGGKEKPEFYLEQTKGKTLLAFAGSHPDLLASWKGEILFFNAPIPSQHLINEFAKIEEFKLHVGNGGNVLGACTYIAKGYLGANPLAFVGADFCFSYKNQFHAWDSKYDKDLGNAMRTIDVFGNSVRTWQSYYNFKCWFDYIAQEVPGTWINCSEGGTFGAYNEGNIQQVIQMPLSNLVSQYTMHKMLELPCSDPKNAYTKDQVKLLF